MIYKVNWMERKTTSTGKNKIDAELIDVSGAPIANVTIWSDFPNFETLAPGHQIEGEVVSKQNGQYTNKTLYAHRTPKTASGYTKSPSAINRAIDKKQEGIKQSQENKEHSIKIASTMTSAVNLAIAQLGKEMDRAEYEAAIEKWREWLWKNWDVADDKYPPF